MESEHEDTFHAVADAVVSGKDPEILKHGPVAPPMSYQIPVRDKITGIAFRVEEAITRPMLKTVTAQHEVVDNRLSAIRKLFIGRIVKNFVNSSETIAHITVAVTDKSGLIIPTTTLVKLKQRKYTDKRENIL